MWNPFTGLFPKSAGSAKPIDHVPWEVFTDEELKKDTEAENKRRVAEGKDPIDPPSVRYARKIAEARAKHGKPLEIPPLIVGGVEPRE